MNEGQRHIPRVTRDAVQKAQADMQRLAETRNPNGSMPQRITRPSVVRVLRSEIAAMFKQGYELEDVTAVLAQHGIEIDSRAFREYWRSTRRKSNRKVTGDPEQ